MRRLRENRRSTEPRPEARVVLDANLEVRSSVAYATFAVVLVFFPILALSGVAGRLFAPLGIAYILAVLAACGRADRHARALDAVAHRQQAAGMERSASRPLEPSSLQGHAGSHRAFSEAGYRDRDRPHDRRRGDVAVLRQHLPARSEGRTPDPPRRRRSPQSCAWLRGRSAHTEGSQCPSRRGYAGWL